MRISIFTNLDLYSNIAVNYLLPELKKHQFQLFLSEKVGGNKQQIQPLQHLSYLEKDFIINKLFPLIENQPPGGCLSFRQISERYSAPLESVASVLNEELLEKLKANAPDLFISIRFGKIFKGEILSIPTKGIINLHSAILPGYKGVLGTFRALQYGESEIGATIHYITDSNIDTGDIIDIIKLKVSINQSVLTHIANLYEPACNGLCQLVNSISRGEKINTFSQPPGGTYFSFPTMEDYADLKKRSIRLFYLNEYASLVHKHYGVDKFWVLNELKNEADSLGIPFEM